MKYDLRKLRQTELEILKTFDSFCKKNNLKYSLFFGSLLGAVRHQGFIPWDDDLDVCMPRDDYDKFLELWNNSPETKGFILQNKINSPAFTQTFTKIRKDHTTFVETEFEIGLYHHGIYVDVFPMDKIPTGFIKEKIYLWNSLKYLLFSREYADPKSSPLVKFASNLILRTVTGERRKKARCKLYKHIEKNNKLIDNYQYIHVSTFNGIKFRYKKEIFNSMVQIQFEDGMFNAFEDWDYVLRTLYGDYMQLPPKDKQVLPHHPIIIDFDKNFEELNLNYEQK